MQKIKIAIILSYVIFTLFAGFSCLLMKNDYLLLAIIILMFATIWFLLLGNKMKKATVDITKGFTFFFK